MTSIDKRREERRRSKEAGLGNAPTPQARAVELIRKFIVTNVGYDAGHLMTVQAHELTILLGDAGLLSSGLEIRCAQKLAWSNKIAKGFNTTDVALEFGLLTAEVGEAFTAWRKRLPDLGEELADIVIYAMALAEMNNLDLNVEVENKIAKNSARIYGRDANGVPVRTFEPSGAASTSGCGSRDRRA
jgi:NTP pyrophosphatase (non-canonical NTP hydrolase)